MSYGVHLFAITFSEFILSALNERDGVCYFIVTYRDGLGVTPRRVVD